MSRPQMFIASSGKAEPLVKELIQALDKKKVQCVPWRGSFGSGDYFVPALIEQTSKYDFAAVLLTEDDKTEKKGDKLVVPRDNCIFELGFFMAALGRDPMRCFMLSSITKEKALPSDLAGRTYIPIRVQGKARKQSINNAAKEIMKWISRRGPLKRSGELPFMTADQLMLREKPERVGGDLQIEQGTKAVVVNSAEPIERDYEMAKKVHANMKLGVNYEYFFGREDRNAVFVANLIQILAMAGLTKREPDESQRLSIMAKQANKVAINLNLMKKHMSIHFRKRPPLQFCVHNADKANAAVCYLRYVSDDFVIWRRNEEAVAVAEELTRACRTDEKDKPEYIFHSTEDVRFSDKENGFQAMLRAQTLQRFPARLRKKVEAVCFEKRPR